MKRNNYSPSIDIIRDQDKEFNYIPTANAERVIENLNKNISKGIKSFYLVGSYGTGKSSFLLALEKQISQNNRHFFKTPITFNGKIKYEYLNIVGDFISIDEKIRSALKINSKKNIFEVLEKKYESLNEKGKGLLIAIDEFGKFLEFASQNKPEKELYLIQRLAEFANHPTRNILFLTTLHQGFDSYRLKVKDSARNEWEKVKGRLLEIPFNEPVEQLLYLASKYYESKRKNIHSIEFDILYDLIIQSRVFPLNNNLTKDLAKQLLPFDLISIGVFTKALQKYGQNERSLFTFLETNDLTSIMGFFNLENVYEYLINNFYSLLSSKANPDFIKWTVIKNSIERTEILFEKESLPKEKIIKTIGLLNIFAPTGARINKKFLQIYGKYALNISDMNQELEVLLKKQVLRYRDYSDSYVLFEGTDFDLDLALNEAENSLIQTDSIVPALKEYFNFPPVSAKSVYINKGTPRFFEYIISDSPIVLQPKAEIDGFINIIFNSNALVKTKTISKECNEAILYAVNKSSEKITDELKELEKINLVYENITDDRVVLRELKNLKEVHIDNLNKLVIDSLFFEDGVEWIYRGEKINIKSYSDLNKKLSEIINDVYYATPIYKNELNNREKVSSVIMLASKVLLQNVLNILGKEDLSYVKKNYPLYKTIYQNFLKCDNFFRKLV
ncbi:MAG: hypothetical protein NTX22_15615 [Ignavibacteriales bacterium]|nr:hypothetical protein [Ignavibacteriales bacterium]